MTACAYQSSRGRGRALCFLSTEETEIRWKRPFCFIRDNLKSVSFPSLGPGMPHSPPPSRALNQARDGRDPTMLGVLFALSGSATKGAGHVWFDPITWVFGNCTTIGRLVPCLPLASSKTHMHAFFVVFLVGMENDSFVRLGNGRLWSGCALRLSCVVQPRATRRVGRHASRRKRCAKQAARKLFFSCFCQHQCFRKSKWMKYDSCFLFSVCMRSTYKSDIRVGNMDPCSLGGASRHSVI